MRNLCSFGLCRCPTVRQLVVRLTFGIHGKATRMRPVQQRCCYEAKHLVAWIRRFQKTIQPAMFTFSHEQYSGRLQRIQVKCYDLRNWQCYGWARLGYCDPHALGPSSRRCLHLAFGCLLLSLQGSSNAGYMRRNCRHSCNLCGRPSCLEFVTWRFLLGLSMPSCDVSSASSDRESCRGLNQPCWINAQCCSARCAQTLGQISCNNIGLQSLIQGGWEEKLNGCARHTYHCRPVGR